MPSAFLFTSEEGTIISKELRINEEIRCKEVRLVDDAGQQLGVMVPREAVKIAAEKNLDLVEVAPTANPPVCRIMDYGKYKYEQSKKEREALRFIQQAVMDFNAGYGAKYGVIAVESTIYR